MCVCTGCVCPEWILFRIFPVLPAESLHSWTLQFVRAAVVFSRSLTSLQIPPAASHLQVSALVIREASAITSDNLRLFFLSLSVARRCRELRGFTPPHPAPSLQLVPGPCQGRAGPEFAVRERGTLCSGEANKHDRFLRPTGL